MGIPGWGTLAGKIAEQFQGRIERLKNEKQRLEDEKNILIQKDFSASADRRLAVINPRLREINRILENKASD